MNELVKKLSKAEKSFREFYRSEESTPQTIVETLNTALLDNNPETKIGGYLSDKAQSLYKYFINRERNLLIAPTGRGKTTLIKKVKEFIDNDPFAPENYLVLAVPTRAIANDIVLNMPDDVYFHKAEKNYFALPSHLETSFRLMPGTINLVVYDSLPKLNEPKAYVKPMGVCSDMPYDITVVIDEADTMLNAYSYRKDALNKLDKALEKLYYSVSGKLTVVEMTATAQNLLEMVSGYKNIIKFEDDKSIKTRKSTNIDTFKMVTKSPRTSFYTVLERVITHTQEIRTDKAIICHNNKNDNTKLKNELVARWGYKDEEIMVISADTISSEIQDKINNDSNIKLLIGTEVLATGINIKPHFRYSITTLFDPDKIIQVAGRIRSNDKVEAIAIMSYDREARGKAKDLSESILCCTSVYTELMETAVEEIIIRYNQARPKRNLRAFNKFRKNKSKKLTKADHEENQRFYRTILDGVVENYNREMTIATGIAVEFEYSGVVFDKKGFIQPDTLQLDYTEVDILGRQRELYVQSLEGSPSNVIKELKKRKVINMNTPQDSVSGSYRTIYKQTLTKERVIELDTNRKLETKLSSRFYSEYEKFDDRPKLNKEFERRMYREGKDIVALYQEIEEERSYIRDIPPIEERKMSLKVRLQRGVYKAIKNIPVDDKSDFIYKDDKSAVIALEMSDIMEGILKHILRVQTFCALDIINNEPIIRESIMPYVVRYILNSFSVENVPGIAHHKLFEGDLDSKICLKYNYDEDSEQYYPDDISKKPLAVAIENIAKVSHYNKDSIIVNPKPQTSTDILDKIELIEILHGYDKDYITDEFHILVEELVKELYDDTLSPHELAEVTEEEANNLLDDLVKTGKFRAVNTFDVKDRIPNSSVIVACPVEQKINDLDEFIDDLWENILDHYYPMSDAA